MCGTPRQGHTAKLCKLCGSLQDRRGPPAHFPASPLSGRSITGATDRFWPNPEVDQHEGAPIVRPTLGDQKSTARQLLARITVTLPKTSDRPGARTRDVARLNCPDLPRKTSNDRSQKRYRHSPDPCHAQRDGCRRG